MCITKWGYISLGLFFSPTFSHIKISKFILSFDDSLVAYYIFYLQLALAQMTNKKISLGLITYSNPGHSLFPQKRFNYEYLHGFTSTKSIVKVFNNGRVCYLPIYAYLLVQVVACIWVIVAMRQSKTKKISIRHSQSLPFSSIHLYNISWYYCSYRPNSL